MSTVGLFNISSNNAPALRAQTRAHNFVTISKFIKLIKEHIRRSAGAPGHTRRRAAQWCATQTEQRHCQTQYKIPPEIRNAPKCNFEMEYQKGMSAFPVLHAIQKIKKLTRNLKLHKPRPKRRHNLLR